MGKRRGRIRKTKINAEENEQRKREETNRRSKNVNKREAMRKMV